MAPTGRVQALAQAGQHHEVVVEPPRIAIEVRHMPAGLAIEPREGPSAQRLLERAGIGGKREEGMMGKTLTTDARDRK